MTVTSSTLSGSKLLDRLRQSLSLAADLRIGNAQAMGRELASYDTAAAIPIGLTDRVDEVLARSEEAVCDSRPQWASSIRQERAMLASPRSARRSQ